MPQITDPKLLTPAAVYSIGRPELHRFLVARIKTGRDETLAEQMITLQVEHLPEGLYLATSEAIPGLVAQGRTVTETLEIARDVARRLLEARAERGESIEALPISNRFEMPLVVGG